MGGLFLSTGFTYFLKYASLLKVRDTHCFTFALEKQKETMKKLILVPLFSIVLMSFAVTNRPEHELHAMMVYNFVKYIEWPTSQEDFTIGVIGDNEVYNTLNDWYGGKIRGGKKFKVVQFQSVEEYLPCSIVYLGSQSKEKLKSVKEKIGGQSVLLITNRPGFAELGSAINFKTVGNKLRFELNQQAIESANLKVSSQLTAMAILL